MQWPWSKKKAPIPSKRAFAAAQLGRLVSDWVAQSTSMDAEIKGNIKLLRNRTRQLERDNDYIRSFLREVEINVIGQGIKFQAQVKQQRGDKFNEALNDEIEAKWKYWCKANRCHVAGKLGFTDMERLIVRSIARDGDFSIRLVKQKFGDSRVPLALELIEADRLDDDYSGIASNGNEVRMGVEINQWGRPVAYYYLTYHPGDYPFAGQRANQAIRTRVPAEEILHPFITERAGQTRGIPWVVTAIMRMHHMAGYTEAEVIAARASAAVMGFIESPEGELQGDAVDGHDRVTDFEPGAWKYLAPGEKPVVPDTKRPSSQHEAFTKTMLRGTAAGVGMSFEGLTKDFSNGNFSASRLALLSDRDLWRVIQKWIEEQVHQRIFEAWLEMAVLSGELNLPQYETMPERYTAVRWKARGWGWVDPEKEVNANRLAIAGGLTSITKVVAEQGDDIEELFQEISRERKLAQSLGLKFDTDAQNIKPALPPGKTPPDDTTAPGDDPKKKPPEE